MQMALHPLTCIQFPQRAGGDLAQIGSQTNANHFRLIGEALFGRALRCQNPAALLVGAKQAMKTGMRAAPARV